MPLQKSLEINLMHNVYLWFISIAYMYLPTPSTQAGSLLYYLPIGEGRIFGLISFLKVLVLYDIKKIQDLNSVRRDYLLGL